MYRGLPIKLGSFLLLNGRRHCQMLEKLKKISLKLRHALDREVKRKGTPPRSGVYLGLWTSSVLDEGERKTLVQFANLYGHDALDTWMSEELSRTGHYRNLGGKIWAPPQELPN